MESVKTLGLLLTLLSLFFLSLTSQFFEEEIEFIEHPKKENNGVSRIRSNIKKSVKPELDLRGMRYDEAEMSLDKYIDDCLVTNMPFATIIHGYGTLTLRKLVKTYVAKNNHIQSYRDGEGGEGGTGVTVVNFK